MHQELLTATSKQTVQWLQSENEQDESTAQLIDFVQEGVDAFTKAQKNFLDVVAQETGKISGGKGHVEGARKAEVAELAHEAGTAFIEAQKRLLDVMGQQMNVSLDATTKALKLISPSRLQPLATMAGERVRDFVDAESSLIGSLRAPRKTATAQKRSSRARKSRAKAVAV
jgi:hypothetical protein